MPAPLTRPLVAATVVLAAVAALACRAPDEPSGPGPNDPDAAAVPAHSYGLWTPTRPGECPKDLHDRYSVIGPDGKRYPTWHPPVDPSGCSFGHEHGRNPAGSALAAAVGSVPFGFANEILAETEAGLTRHEDHVGHKIEWENGVMLQRSAGGSRVDLGVRCDFLIKIHQGTHSADAFTNNLHELAYHVRCTDGTELHATLMSAIGRPGEFVRSCDKQTVIAAGAPVPAGSPAGGGVRFIPDRSCVDQFVLVPDGAWSDYSRGLYEDWITANYLITESGRQLAYWDPHFAVFSPSRYFDPAEAGSLARTLDACYLVLSGDRRARGGICDWSTSAGQLELRFDDPLSGFNGVHRETYFNQTAITNPDGPSVWFSDPFGRRARPDSFPGSIRQTVAGIDNTRPFPLESQAFGASRDYGATGTHAPN
ncbi:MAG: hypothetical protein AB7L66_03935 [Gemmatimonadales bacterium]